MKKAFKQKGTANPLKQGQVKAWLIVLLSVFCTCVSFAQKQTIKQGPLAKGVKLTNQALYIGEDESCYYFFDYYSKITLVSFDKTDLSLKTEKDFKGKMSMRLLIYGGIYGENIEVLTVKHEAKGYRLEKLTFKKSDMTLTSTEDLGFSPFEDGKKHFSNMDPVKLKEMLTVSSKTSPNQSYRALVRLDQSQNEAPGTWKIAVLDNTTNTTLWSRDTDIHFHDYVITNDGKVVLVGYYLADSKDKAVAALVVMTNDGEELMSFPLPVNIGSAELTLNGDRLWVTGSLKGEKYGDWMFLFNRNAALSGMYVTLFDLNEQAVVTSDEYPFTKEDVGVLINAKEGKNKNNEVHWIDFYPFLMNDGRVCVKGEYDYTETISTHTGVYYWFGKKGCNLSMFDTDGKLLWKKPYRNNIVGPQETVNDAVFDLQGNLCYYSMVCSKYEYSETDAAASQDPRLLQTKLREIILDQEGNETVNVIDGKGEFGIAAQSYNSDKTKRLFLLLEQGLIKSDVRLVVVD